MYQKNPVHLIKLQESLDELKLPRRTQVGIVDNEGDVVYYIANIIEWTKTKLKDNVQNINEDPKMQELVDLGYQIHSGLKFGTHYRVYDYESNHAPWLIHVIKEGINRSRVYSSEEIIEGKGPAGRAIQKKIFDIFNFSINFLNIFRTVAVAFKLTHQKSADPSGRRRVRTSAPNLVL